MISRDQLKADLDGVAESHFEVLQGIIAVFKSTADEGVPLPDGVDENPLKGSVIFEGDILSSVDETWSAER